MKKLVFILCLGLAACTVGPDFKAPSIPAAKAYTSGKDALPASQLIALGKEIESQWWTLFNSTALDSVIRQALADNYDIAAAKETVAEADEAVKAETGNLFPRIAITGTGGRQKYGVALFGPSDFMVPPFNYYEIGPEVSWTPDIFGGERRRIERAKALAEYQSHELDAAYVTLTGNVALEGLTIAETKAEIDAASQMIAGDEKMLALVENAFRAGARTKLDILTAQSQVDNDKAALPPLMQRLSVAQHALSILVGKAPADWTAPDFTTASFTLPKTLPVSLPSTLVHKRADILAAEANLHAASAAVGIATANLYPSITLSANTLQEALSPAGIFKSVSNAWSLAGNLTIPVFSGGRGTAEKHEAEHAYLAALAQYRQTILHAFGQVADALTALAQDGRQLAAEQQAVTSAENTLALARKSYEMGNGNLLEIEDAGHKLAEARLGFVHIESQRFMDTAQLFVSLGGSPAAR